MAKNADAQAKAIPLVLPNNCTWDEKTGTYDKKTGVERTSLNVVQKALDQLREIKGPVCVVSIAGPCRKGKSYILTKAFEQDEVFPVGHFMNPETMGIWLWVVPQTFKDSTGRDFTVVLLDSEGFDAIFGNQDDDKIFTLAVLLSSILIYNFSGVPKLTDVEDLDFIVKLSQRIQLHTKKRNARDDDDSHFYEAFPNFIWLLRDVVLGLPKEVQSLKEYFLKKVLHDQSLNENGKKTADCIFNFFSGFDAFSLSPPAFDLKVVANLNDKRFEAQINPRFVKEVQAFKRMLHSKLSPKNSINEGEFVTGEALAVLIQIFVEAINTPGAVPNVQDAWDTFVHNKCKEALAAALAAYKQEMTSRVEDNIPCEADVMRAAHLKAVDVGFRKFREETFNLSIKSVENYFNELKREMENATEEQRLKLKFHEEVARLKKEKEVKEREMALIDLREKQEDERIRLEQMFEDKLRGHKEQIDNMTALVNAKERQQEREAALARQKTMEDMVKALKDTLEKRDKQIGDLREDIKQKEASTMSDMRQALQTKEAAISSLVTKITQLENDKAKEERVREKTISDLQRSLATRQDELQTVMKKMDEQSQNQKQFQQLIREKDNKIHHLKDLLKEVSQDAGNRMSEMQQEIGKLQEEKSNITS